MDDLAIFYQHAGLFSSNYLATLHSVDSATYFHLAMVVQVESDFPSIEVEEFLNKNGVHEGWKVLILKSVDLYSALKRIIDILHNYNRHVTPNYTQVLRAFSYCRPENIKVIIIGTSPISGKGMATGLSFSFDGMEDDLDSWEERSIHQFHDALWIAETGH